jgi:hypothetical protein
MGANVATARVRPSRSRPVPVVRSRDRTERLRAASPSGATIVAGPDDARGAAMFGARARWRAACERWSQLTFYLFDPESWR